MIQITHRLWGDILEMVACHEGYCITVTTQSKQRSGAQYSQISILLYVTVQMHCHAMEYGRILASGPIYWI